MFTHLAIHHPHPEHREALRASMRRVDAAARASAGLIRIDDWAEIDGDRLVGIAIWESREAYEAAAQTIFAAVAGDPFDVWWASPPETIYLESAGPDAQADRA
jgi:quinol monooxygenase YgiN